MKHELPGSAGHDAGRIRFMRRIEPAPEAVEDADTARLVTRFQAGDATAFRRIYDRHVERIYAYLRLTVRDRHEAEDLAQQVFLDLFTDLRHYEQRGAPFRSWLFTVARNRALKHLDRHRRVETRATEELDRTRDRPVVPETGLNALGWITDQDLLVLIDRLPVSQQQVIALRFLLDLSAADIARVLERSEQSVRVLQHRGLAFLRARLTALGREPRGDRAAGCERPMRRSRVIATRRFGLTTPGPTG